MQKKRLFIKQFAGLAPFTFSQSLTSSLHSDVVLRDYQIEGIQWLLFLNKFSLHGILGDDMGLGKSLQALTTLITAFESSSPSLPSIIVCPNTLVSHWCSEYNRFFPDGPLQFVPYKGGIEERKKLRKKVISTTVLVMSYNIMRQDTSDLNKFLYFYCILDEVCIYLIFFHLNL